VFKTGREQGAIIFTQPVKSVFKRALKSHEGQQPERHARFVSMFAVQLDIAVKPHHQRRHERP